MPWNLFWKILKLTTVKFPKKKDKNCLFRPIKRYLPGHEIEATPRSFGSRLSFRTNFKETNDNLKFLWLNPSYFLTFILIVFKFFRCFKVNRKAIPALTGLFVLKSLKNKKNGGGYLRFTFQEGKIVTFQTGSVYFKEMKPFISLIFSFLYSSCLNFPVSSGRKKHDFLKHDGYNSHSFCGNKKQSCPLCLPTIQGNKQRAF